MLDLDIGLLHVLTFIFTIPPEASSSILLELVFYSDVRSTNCYKGWFPRPYLHYLLTIRPLTKAAVKPFIHGPGPGREGLVIGIFTFFFICEKPFLYICADVGTSI